MKKLFSSLIILLLLTASSMAISAQEETTPYYRLWSEIAYSDFIAIENISTEECNRIIDIASAANVQRPFYNGYLYSMQYVLADICIEADAAVSLKLQIVSDVSLMRGFQVHPTLIQGHGLYALGIYEGSLAAFNTDGLIFEIMSSQEGNANRDLLLVWKAQTFSKLNRWQSACAAVGNIRDEATMHRLVYTQDCMNANEYAELIGSDATHIELRFYANMLRREGRIAEADSVEGSLEFTSLEQADRSVTAYYIGDGELTAAEAELVLQNYLELEEESATWSLAEKSHYHFRIGMIMEVAEWSIGDVDNQYRISDSLWRDCVNDVNCFYAVSLEVN